MCFYHESNMMGQESGGCPPFFSSISTLLRNRQHIKQSNCSVQTGALIVATTDEAVVTSAFRDFTPNHYNIIEKCNSGQLSQ